MKRTISFVVALVMCCSLLLPALPAANAMVMDFIWDEPGQTAPERKVSFEILEQMAQAEDDELISVRVHLKRLPRETIEALVPMTKPSNYVNESTQEERDAWSQAEYQTRQRVNGGITRAFIDRYFDEADKPASLGVMDTPSFNCSVNKAKLAALAALDEVIWINEAWMSIYLVQEPTPQEKLTGTLYEYLQNAGEDERIPVRIWLRGFRTEEYEALNPLPYPTFASTPEELAAYRSAASQASRELNFDYFNPCATFVRNRLNDGELLYQPEMFGIPVIVVKTTPARIAALAKLRIVSQIDPAFGYDEAFPDPELPAEPGQLNKIEARLQEFMTIAAHDELIPIAMSLKEPSQAEIDALRTVSQPGGGATIDEMNTYIHDDRQAKRQVYSALTSAFVENHLDESDEVILRSNYTTSVWAIVPKFKIAELAALEEVREISWALGYDDPAIPPDGGETVFLPPEESALSEKIAWPLQVKMTGTADDTPLRVRINLDAPTLEEIKAANPAPEHMTLAEYTAYTNSLTQKYSQARAAVYEPFVQNYLNTAEEQVEAPENYYILATLSKTRIAALANLNEVTSITQWHEQDPMELVLPPEEPGVQAVPEKIEARVQREMNGAAEDEIIGILLWLNAPTHKEIDATVPPPEDPTDPDQVEAFQRAAYRARAATEHGIVEAFVQNHMPGTNELHYAGQDGPYLLAGTTKSRILALTALEEVVRIDREDWPAFPQDDVPQVPTVDPKPPVDPEVLKKLSSELVKYMEGKADDAMIPIAVYLDSPSSAEIEAMVPIPQPDVYSAVTMEEVNAYIHAKRAVAWEVNSTITTAFVENYLDENDTVRYAGKAIPVVICNVPKSKVLSLAALEEVIDIGYAPVVSLYPTWIHDYSEDAIKLTEPLKAYMENLADEEPVAIRVDLRMPTEEIMEMIVPLPKPGEDASQEEIDAYNEAYRQTWREQVSLRTDGFMHYYVHETDPVYYIGEDDATVICEIPVARLRSAASDQSVIQIDLAGQLADVPAPCEHDYEAVVTAPTCTEVGFTTYTCARCGDSYVDDRTPATGHFWDGGRVTKEATETEQGERTFTCTRCGEKRVEAIRMAGPAAQKKLTLSLLEETAQAADDAIVPVSICLKGPSDAEIEALIPLPEPDASATEEEISAYSAAKTETRNRVCSGLADAFAQKYLDGAEEVTARRLMFTAGLKANVRKSKIPALAALDEVLRIGGSSETVYPVPEKAPAEKLSETLREVMETAADDDRIPVRLWLLGQKTEEEELLNPLPYPTISSSPEELQAYRSAAAQARRAVSEDPVGAFAQNHLDENDEVLYQSELPPVPIMIVSVPKSRIAELAELHMVARIDSAASFHDVEPPVQDPVILRKCELYLREFMRIAPDDERTAIYFYLKEPSQAEIDALITVSEPGPDATQEETDAYWAAKHAAQKQVYSAITGAFIGNHLDASDEVLYQGAYTTTVVAVVPLAKAAALAALEEVTRLGWDAYFDQPSVPGSGEPVFVPEESPELPKDPAVYRKIDAYTLGFMENLPEDEGVPVSFWLKAPSDAELEAMVPLSPPADDATMEEVNAYLTAKRRAVSAIMTEITDAFVRDRLDESDEIIFQSLLVPTVWAVVPKDRVLSLASADEVLQINYYSDPDHAVAPAMGVDKRELVKWINEPLPPMEYTEETMQAYHAVVDKAIDVNEKANASQEEVDAAVAEIKAARTALKPPDYELLLAAIAGAEAIDRSKYGAEALAAMDQALAAAREARSILSQTRIDAAAAALEAAVEALPEKQHVHDYTAVVTAPTCTEAGFTTYTCACGDSYVDSEVAALGHDYQDGVCTRCGAKDPDYEEPVIEPFRFDDVKDDKQFYYEPVYWAVEKGITKGTSETLFSPDAGCTRAQVVTFLWRAAGEPEFTIDGYDFIDVNTDAYYFKALQWAVEKGITKGTSADRFSPNTTCTRAQIVTFLYRAAGEPELTEKANPFKDVAEGQYYADAVLWAVEKGITRGRSADAFAPNATCTRGEIVTFLYRAAK